MILLHFLNRDDEEEGSPLQNGATSLPRTIHLAAGENREFSGSPPGVPPPDHLSLRKNFATRPLGNIADKNA